MAVFDTQKIELANVFDFLDYRKFLSAWAKSQRFRNSRFSLRKLSQDAGLSVGFLPLVLSEKRGLTGKTAGKLAPHLQLSTKEQRYFINLVELAEARGRDKRIKALNRLSRSRSFKEGNPGELEVYKLLSNWQKVVIKELAAMPFFKVDPQWIQKQLIYPATLKEIREALDFLHQQKFIEVNGEKARVVEKQTTCNDGIYQILMGNFHQTMLKLAAESVDRTDKDERELHGVTVGLGQESFEKAREIMNAAIKEIMKLEDLERSQDRKVYHIEMAAFPLTKGRVS